MPKPAASLPYLALHQGIPLAEINLDKTPLSSQTDFALNGPAGVILPALIDAVWE